MNKYIVSYDDTIEAVAKSRADAEELILSLCEEQNYEEFLAEIIFYGATPKDYLANCIADLEDINDYRHKYPSISKRPYQTLNGYMLSFYGNNYKIYEAKELN